jgi:glycosyltransferase involved in cell wall biosynthesis
MTLSPDHRLLVISPVRNEAKHFHRVALAMASQTRPPDAWVIVDDGSTDGTAEILAALEREVDFVTVLGPPPVTSETVVKDRLAMAAAPRAFNRGLRSVPWRTFTHIAKLDGDTELPDRYFETLLDRFAADPDLGLAGGVRTERVASGWRLERVPQDYHVPGALKCYSLPCFEAIGGMQERLGWDTIDEVYARMHGYHTRAFADLVAVHHRLWGSADGALRGRARHGRCHYIARYPLPWVLARAPKQSRGEQRRVLSTLYYVGGYLGCAIRRAPRVEDPAYCAFMRRELAGRVLRAARPLSPALRPRHSTAQHFG